MKIKDYSIPHPAELAAEIEALRRLVELGLKAKAGK